MNIFKSEFVEMFGEGSCKQIPFSEYAEIIDGDRGKNYPKSEDFSDDDFDKAAEVNSNTQLYKQAGNSIVKNVLVAILGQMISGKENKYKY